MSVLVQRIAWRRTGDKPLSGSMIAYFSDAYMCPQWVDITVTSGDFVGVGQQIKSLSNHIYIYIYMCIYL